MIGYIVCKTPGSPLPLFLMILYHSHSEYTMDVNETSSCISLNSVPQNLHNAYIQLLFLNRLQYLERDPLDIISTIIETDILFSICYIFD